VAGVTGLFPIAGLVRIPRVKAWLRMPAARVGLAVAIVVATLLAWRLFGASPNEHVADAPVVDLSVQLASAPQVLPAAPPVARPLTLDALGAPDDALPPPLQFLPTGEPIQSDAGAEALAREHRRADHAQDVSRHDMGPAPQLMLEVPGRTAPRARRPPVTSRTGR
jgi:hypothetical protein